MKIRMKKSTRWNEQPLAAGQEVEVEDRVANRWISNGIAEMAGSADSQEKIPANTDGPSGADDANTGDTGENLEALKQKELIEAAARKGIAFKPGTTKKQLIGLIRKVEGRISGE
jgi:hypothetical protein